MYKMSKGEVCTYACIVCMYACIVCMYACVCTCCLCMHTYMHAAIYTQNVEKSSKRIWELYLLLLLLFMNVFPYLPSFVFIESEKVNLLVNCNKYVFITENY